MSAYSTTQTQFTDPDLLIEALRELGYTPTICLDNPQHLTGYTGDTRPETAHIIIPRHQVGGASNDVGYIRGTDGTFRAIVSAYDSRTHFAPAKQQKLSGVYADCKVKREAKRAGLRMTGRKVENGKTVYQFVKA